MQNLRLVDRVLEVEKGNSRSYRDVKRQLQNTHLELIVCAHESVRSALLVFGLRADAKRGYAKFWNHLVFNQRVRRDLRLPEALRQLQLIGFADPRLRQDLENYAHNNSLATLGPVPTWASMQVVDQSLASGGQKSLRIGIFPGSVWATKRWTVEGFAELIRKLTQQGFNVVLMGSPAEESIGAEIAGLVPPGSFENLIGRHSLWDTLQEIRNCNVIVSNDSGGQHLAAVAGVATVAIFGPTVLSLGYRPWNPQTSVVEVVGLSCRPCGLHGHKVCPIGTHDCMKGISAEQVMVAVQKALQPGLSTNH